MARGLGTRFNRYCDALVEVMAHADRVTPAQWYLKGLVLPGDRKSIEPMAARVHPENVRSAHQSMHHLVADADWSDRAVLETVAKQVIPTLTEHGQRPCVWIIDDTGIAKKGRHSVGVARPYCGRLGKTDNCQVAVSLSLATDDGSLPLDYQLYLPQEWADDPARRKKAGVPEELCFATKLALAHGHIERALKRQVPRGPLLADAGYGDDAALRDWLTEQGVPYAVGIRRGTAVWWEDAKPAPTPSSHGRGRPRKRVLRDKAHQPVRVLDVAKQLPCTAWRKVSWREGTSGVLSSRFARVRVTAAQADRARAEEWLIMEWPPEAPEPTHYWLATFPADISFRSLVDTIKMRWRIERDYEELKGELGLAHYEGRNWRGFHHHATLCIAAYGFLMRERLCGFKKNRIRFPTPALPEGFRPRGARPDATTRSRIHR